MQQNESVIEITKKGCPMTFFILSKMSYVTKVCHAPTADDCWSFFFIFEIVSNWLIPMKKYLSCWSLVWTCEDMGHKKVPTTMATDSAAQSWWQFLSWWAIMTVAAAPMDALPPNQQYWLIFCCWGWGGGYLAGCTCHNTASTGIKLKN